MALPNNEHGRPVGEGPGGQVPPPQLDVCEIMMQYVYNTGYGIIYNFSRRNVIILMISNFRTGSWWRSRLERCPRTNSVPRYVVRVSQWINFFIYFKVRLTISKYK